MNYIIIDFEFNQFYKETKDRKKPHEGCRFEIIQIGGVKLDENLKEIDTFNGMIKPRLYKALHPFVERLTKISAEQLMAGEAFEDVFEDFIQFIGHEDCTLVVWGTGDLRVLKENIAYYGLDAKEVPEEYINIQRFASRYLNSPKNTSVGLENAIKLLGLEGENAFHDALNDAIYTSEIFKKVFSKAIKTESYNYHHVIVSRGETPPKKVLDNDALVRQFEKMLNRELSEEEIEMITLAYRMGASQQFLVSKQET